ncbi:kinase activator protein [Niveomyces insectorum RCEF 264]|uniref:Kinase activator protein n=1 Tax=Niveomyces insectorum RCEF 264 TaxID=1081102 RepID=A0A167P246_9HYPO|nr:kinase activator protein [Niveomyces insectorum RCEF 264]
MPSVMSFLQVLGFDRGRRRSDGHHSSSFSSSAPSNQTARSRSRYTRLLTDNDNDNDGRFDPYGGSTLDDNGSDASGGSSSSDVSIPLTATRGRARPPRRQRRRRQAVDTGRQNSTPQRLPTARRFWADFTLGFADGLTVPFALTAGLSSLGRTDTVLYAGLAEISAGCISMGISGYLSARQAPPAAGLGSGGNDTDVCVGGAEASFCKDDEEKAATTANQKTTAADTTTFADAAAATVRYLAPLNLPSDLQQRVLAHLAAYPATALHDALFEGDSGDDDDGGDGDGDDNGNTNTSDDASDDHVWPVAAGASVALGYLVGGLLPLWPYFFVTSVGVGLRWSFAVCVVALFLFGFVRDFALSAGGRDAGYALSPTSSLSPSFWPWRRTARSVPWRRIRTSCVEGLQMVVLGSIAAGAAVLCVRMFEGASSEAASGVTPASS